MKKLFALVLAVLTVAGLSTAAFAATVFAPGDLPGFYVTDGSAFALDANDVRQALGYGYGYGYGYGDSGLYTSWIDYCPEDDCRGVAFFRIEGGKVYWVCPTCGESGVISAPGSSSGSSGSVHTATVCPTCGKSDRLSYLEDGVKDGKYYEIYYCSRCQRLVYVEAKPDANEYGLNNTMKCLTKGCGKIAKFKDFIVKDGTVCARYECENGHINNIVVENDIYCPGGYHTRGYYVTVVTVAGGSSSMNSYATARYGETRTVTFTPFSGYTLASVKINGKEVVVTNNRVTFVVEGDTEVVPTFVRTTSLQNYTIRTLVNGSGTVDVAKNGTHINGYATVTAKNADTLVYNFLPTSRNYSVYDVKIDGRSQGAINFYTFTKLNADHTVEVTFAWNNPYADVETKYLSAVEYVTEGGVMGAYTKVNGKSYFCGRTGITVGDLVNALAELCDTAGKLNSDADRRAWAVNYGIISKKTELSADCDVQQACTIIKNYLEVLEDLNKVTFTKLNRKATVRENAISLNLATAKTFDANRNLHRYDLAAICRLVARLEYKG